MSESVLEEPAAIGKSGTLVRRLVHGGIWVAAGRTAGIGLAFLSHIMLARWLSPPQFGMFLMLVSVVSFLSIGARFGLDRILVRFLSEGLGTDDARLVRRTLRISVVVALVSTLVVTVSTLVVFASLHHSLGLTSLAVLWVTAAIPLFTLLFLLAEALRGFHQLQYASLFQAQSGPLTNLGFLLLVLVASVAQPSLSLALACYVLPVACILPWGIICLLRTARRGLAAIESHGTTANSLSVPQTLAVCTPVAASDVLNFTAANAGLWIAAAFCSGEDLALFGAARQLVMLVALPLNLINLTVISSIPELYTQGRSKELQRVLQVTASVGMLPTVVLAAMCIFTPVPLLSTVFGSFYSQAAIVLIILSVARLVSAWTGSCLNTLLLTGRHKSVLAMNLLLVAVLFVFGPVYARAYGAVGIAVVSASIFAMINLAAWLLARAKVGVWTHATIFWPRLSLRSITTVI